MSMNSAFRKQGFTVAWRGDQPTISSDITTDYLAGTVDNMPRVNMGDGETLDGLDIGLLQTDFDAELIVDAAQELVNDDLRILREAGKDLTLVLTELVQWTLDNTSMAPTDFTESVKDAFLDLQVIANRLK